MTTAVFIDTSIRIGEIVHSPLIKQAIRERRHEFDITITGLVVRQEFKRRLLREAQYLLGVLEDEKSLTKTWRRVHDYLTNERKSRICVQILESFNERHEGGDAEERLRLFLRSLLKGGLDEFDATVDCVLRESGCTCGSSEIRRTHRGRFDFGRNKCDQARPECQISTFFDTATDSVEEIRGYLATVDSTEKSAEIKSAETCLVTLANGTDPRSLSMCLNHGDLTIALESRNVRCMYTMNFKESCHYCKALGQILIYRHPNPKHEEEEYDAE